MLDEFLDKPQLFLPSVVDVTTVIEDFTVTEITTLVGLGLWFIVLALPLSGIDRRDNITGLTYMLYAVAGGITLTVVVPGKLANFSDTFWQLLILAALTGVTLLRWIKKSSGKIVIVDRPAEEIKS